MLEQPVSVSCPYCGKIIEIMSQGSKNKYTDKQKRQAAHIAEGYESRNVPKEVAKARAWATVNKIDGGGKKGGSGRA